MAEKFVLRVKKLKNELSIRASIQHVYREKVSDNVNPEKIVDNEKYVDCGDSDNFQRIHEKRLSDENPKQDAKSTQLMEFVISASPEQLSRHDFDQGQYFRDSIKFVESLHGAENILSAVIHRDEDTPHMHVHVVPINQIEAVTRKRSVQVKGGKAGEREIREFVVEAHSTLSANVLYGGPRKLSALQTAFEQQVGVDYGLSREKRFVEGQEYAAEQHVSPRQYRGKLNAIAERLEGRESDVTLNFAKIDLHWKLLERDKSRLVEDQARITGELEAVAAQKQNLDALASNLADGQQLLALDREEFAKDEKDLAKRLSVLNNREAALKAGLADLTKRQGEMDLRGSQQDQREQSLNFRAGELNQLKSSLDDRKVSMDILEADRTAKIAAVKDTLRQREVALDDRQSNFDGYKDALNKDIAAFKADRMAYLKQWTDLIKAAPSEEEKKKASQQLVAPVQKGKSR